MGWSGCSEIYSRPLNDNGLATELSTEANVDAGVPCTKHFILYGQETNRTGGMGSMDGGTGDPGGWRLAALEIPSPLHSVTRAR
ncbi:hypothetical protein ETB97_011815 [Aspergillus alliaceus]|uniref:Uncharacterized protein n=1 Tax=Petromyces alliaceus TaxID=209559 RepID=A0A5N6FDR2_PETAA|nr:uncharacterized protein BDW43DRAFT_316282 [Aspergillus alliaceus]KAB8228082.1 hypothetical protein BDW43DRAFT_316282 [Aspergillus alliaceus]KAF5862291.1 hypothetical protein ETB97_011815 [Aspergillus burnettii]